ncbi:MAG TPA: transcriptional regulator, partial [Microbacterium sp.]|nr:transcriptional regulator [Microbacterium sp.]
MSNTALLTRPAPARHLHAVPPIAEEPAARAPRGFALYVGLDEAKAAAAGVSLPVLVDALRRTLAELAPDAETYATVALAPRGAGGRDVDVVRRALREPSAIAAATPATEPEDTDRSARGVVFDISRKRIVIDGETAPFTFTEFELLQYLVLREGRTIERSEMVASLWQSADDGEVPGE